MMPRERDESLSFYPQDVFENLFAYELIHALITHAQPNHILTTQQAFHVLEKARKSFPNMVADLEKQGLLGLDISADQSDV